MWGMSNRPKFYHKTSRKNTSKAIKMRQGIALKKRVKAYLRKSPGVSRAAKKFNIPENRIYKMIYSNR
jgi:hypothetical protein